MTHPDEDALVTALDGTQLDVTVDIDEEFVRLVLGGRGWVDLTTGGALAFAEQIKTAAEALRRGDISPL